MLFVAKKRGAKERAWLGLHLGMTGKLRVETARFFAGEARSSRPAAGEARAGFRGRAAVRARAFCRRAPTRRNGGRSCRPICFRSGFYASRHWTKFLKRRARAPIKAVLLMQERFPGIGNWMADEILWRAAIHPEAGRGRARREANEGALPRNPLGLPRSAADHRHEVGRSARLVALQPSLAKRRHVSAHRREAPARNDRWADDVLVAGEAETELAAKERRDRKWEIHFGSFVSFAFFCG